MNEWVLLAIGMAVIALVYHVIAFFLTRRDKDL
jgi:hypothetical protein